MRLLNVHSLQFQEFHGKSVPAYHILSHRWGEQELSYTDVEQRRNWHGPGFRKFIGFCKMIRHRMSWWSRLERNSRADQYRLDRLQDLQDRLDCLKYDGDEAWQRPTILRVSTITNPDVTDWDEFEGMHTLSSEWIWIDTCCIDKRNSAELSEALNSMFNWYKRSAECYVYLSDVPSWNTLRARRSAASVSSAMWSAFRRSSWFRRGWTLQELLAPRRLVFYTRAWEVLDHICQYTQHNCEHEYIMYGPHLGLEVSKITGIPEPFLLGRSALRTASVAQRMSWAAQRETSREEDQAYCLLGIFDINMPLLYGEGSKAFLRLQQEITKTSTDQSIFAWMDDGGSEVAMPGIDPFVFGWPDTSPSGVLAASPSAFVRSGNVVAMLQRETPYTITNSGLALRANLFKVRGYYLATSYEEVFLLRLSCADIVPSNKIVGRVQVGVTIALVPTERSWCFHRILPERHSESFRSVPCVDVGEHLIYLSISYENI